MLLSNALRRVAAIVWVWWTCGINTLYPLITYHMMPDSIVVMICDSTDTVTRKIQVMRLDYVLCMGIINYLYPCKKYAVSELCTV